MRKHRRNGRFELPGISRVEISPRQAHSKMVFDLSQLRFIDSSGLGAFLSCLRQLSTKGGELKLCGLSNQVYQTFELVRMHRIFDIYSTKSEAVQAFQP